MSIFLNNLHRTFKSPMRVAVLVVLPIVFIMAFVPGDYEVPLKVGIIDDDGTSLTQSLQSHLSTMFELEHIDSDMLTSALVDHEVDYVLLISRGFTAGFIAGEDLHLEGYSLSNSAAPALITHSANSFLHAAKTIARASGGDPNYFYEQLGAFESGAMTAEIKPVKGINRDQSTSTFGFLVQFMLYMSVVATGLILDEKSNRAFFRIFAAPINMRQYMTSHLLSAMTVAFIQISAVFLFLRYGMNVYLGESPLNMFLLFLIFGVVCVAFGLFLTSYCKTAKQAYIAIMLITTPLVMLGGCYWPRDWMPDILVRIGDLIPTSYVMQGVGTLLRNGSLASISGELVILIGFAAVFLAAGIMSRKDVAH